MKCLKVNLDNAKKSIKVNKNASITFDLNGQTVWIYFEWWSNEGKGWVFDVTLICPNIDDEIQGRGNPNVSVSTVLESLADLLNIDAKESFVSTMKEDICKIANDFYQKRAPTISATDDYFGF